MFTEEGITEYKKWAEWISDEDFMLSPDFVPDKNTPQGAIDYYKEMISGMFGIDSSDIKFPTGIGLNL